MILLYTTFGSRADARDAARRLVEERLVACANITEIESLYRWEGEVVEDDEVLVLCKTQAEKKEAITELLGDIHPYDVPCIAFYPADDVSDGYSDWLDRSL
jgi:periplasmic divalent cation tolerance protein